MAKIKEIKKCKACPYIRRYDWHADTANYPGSISGCAFYCSKMSEGKMEHWLSDLEDLLDQCPMLYFFEILTWKR